LWRTSGARWDCSGGIVKSIVLASGNPGKKAEIEQLLAPFGTRVVTQVELGITEADEPHDSFLANALAKARHACFATRLPALADDSGLCIDALGGEPGVKSARWEKDDAARIAKALRLLAGVEDERRTARFVCALCFSLPGAADLEVRGSCEGRITRAPRGTNGFGYDPIFEVAGLGKTMAELTRDEKSGHSHRGAAFRALLPKLLAALVS
jgi:XTP/dITP diphosphohydrolase